MESIEQHLEADDPWLQRQNNIDTGSTTEVSEVALEENTETSNN